MKYQSTYIGMLFLLFALLACKKNQEITTKNSSLIANSSFSTDDDAGDLFTLGDEGIEHIENWSPNSFANIPLDSTSRAMYDHLDVYQLSLFYKIDNDLIKLSIYDGEDEYVESLFQPVKLIIENNVSSDTLGRKSNVVSKRGIKAIETIEKFGNKDHHTISFIHDNRYVIIVAGSAGLNKLWDGIESLPLSELN